MSTLPHTPHARAGLASAALVLLGGAGVLMVPDWHARRESWPVQVSGGTIYFSAHGREPLRLLSMSADGRRKRVLPLEAACEPSAALHGGWRWFLVVRPLSAGRYPNGQPRRELFAVRSDGRSVQLTMQPDLEPAPLRARWPRHGRDTLVSFVARRWNTAGVVAGGGIYTATVVFDASGAITGLAAQPRDPCVPIVFAATDGEGPWWQTPAPAICTHDWAPDGGALVFDSPNAEVRVADPRTGRIMRLLPVAGRNPAWSPDGSRIALHVARPGGPLVTIRPDGTGLEPLRLARGLRTLAVATPVWSPSGEELAYLRLGDDRAGFDAPLDMDVFRSGTDGDGPRNLTADLPDFARPIAWRAGWEALPAD